MELKPNSVRSVCLAVTALLLLDAPKLEKNLCAQQPDTEQNVQAGDDDKGSQLDSDKSARDEPTIPSLEEMLKVALEHNPDIRAAKAQLAVYQAELDRTRLEVVKQLTAFREKWQGQNVALEVALDEEKSVESAFAMGVIGQEELLTVREKVRLARAKLRELEAELPYLLGRTDADAGSEQAKDASSSGGRKLLKEKMRPLAERGVELSLKSYRAGEADLEPAINWMQRLLDVELALADDKASHIAALEEQRSRLEELNNVTKAIYRTGNALQQDVLSARYHLLQVELMLLREKADEE